MKVLRIENQQGQYLNSANEFVPIDKLTKEGLLFLVELALMKDIEFDDFDDKSLRNQAHQIIYKNVWEKLKSLRDRKDEFLDESERLFLADYEKYRQQK